MLTASAGTPTTVARAVDPIRILVVDDHPVVCQGLAHLIASDPRLTVVGDARTARSAIDLARQRRPGVVLLDLRLPDMLATEAIPHLRAAAPGTAIVIFTAHAGHAGIRAALSTGVEGVLLKDASDVDLVEAIVRVASGETVVDQRTYQDGLRYAGKRPDGAALTLREYEVLRHVATGETNSEIALAIGLAPNTVKTYLQTAMHKLCARNRIEALARAAEAGLL